MSEPRVARELARAFDAALRRAAMDAARFILSRRVKRLLKRFFDPNRLLPHPDRLDWTEFGIESSPGGSVSGPSISVIIVTCGALPWTRACLISLRTAPFPLSEILVIDNASSDGTRAYLESLGLGDERIRAVFNDQNEGFPAAVNQGLRMVRGEIIVLLNNDTIVPAPALPRLVAHAVEPEVGLVVAVTNCSANESRVEARYSTLQQLQSFAARRAEQFDGKRFDIGTAPMYCVAGRREVFDRVGPLDERFGLGMFEDDDYSARARDAGYRVMCAADAFVHHYGGVSFSTMSQSKFFALEARNKRRFEEKQRS